MEGPLDNMQTSLMTFPPPLKGRMDHRRLYFTALAQGTHAGANSQVEEQDQSIFLCRSKKRTVMQHYTHMLYLVYKYSLKLPLQPSCVEARVAMKRTVRMQHV